MINRLIVTAPLLMALATPSFAQETDPFGLIHYGHFQKMMHMKKTDGIVDLAEATAAPHLYGVGAPAHGTGEITLVNGRLWLDYGTDGLGNAVHTPSDGEQAVLLVTAEVSEWRDVEVPGDMSEDEMHAFILAEAASGGIDTKVPFPIMLDGQHFDLDRQVLNGLRATNGGHDMFEKAREHQADNAGLIVGFYSADIQGVFTHPGESWHLHLLPAASVEKNNQASRCRQCQARGLSVGASAESLQVHSGC